MGNTGDLVLLYRMYLSVIVPTKTTIPATDFSPGATKATHFSGKLALNQRAARQSTMLPQMRNWLQQLVAEGEPRHMARPTDSSLLAVV